MKKETFIHYPKANSMFLQIDELTLLDRQFEKVYMKGRNGYSTFYYKQGIYLEFFFEGFYDVYSSEMDLLATVNNFYRLEILLIASSYPLNAN